MNKTEIKDFLRTKRGYLKFGGFGLAKQLKIKDIELCKQAIREVKFELKNNPGNNNKAFKVTLNKDFDKYTNLDIFKNAFENPDELPTSKNKIIKNEITNKKVLVIGDLHLPFTLDGYLEHCINTYKQYNCNEVIFIGDIIDNHASSFHIPDADGYSAGYELKLAIQQVKEWYKAFPKATIIIGNHDRIIMRKAQASGLSKMWIKDYAEVLGVPNWNFVESIEIDNVLYLHGEGGVARTRARRDLCSIVQGHLHTQASVDWIVGKNFKIFACQTGCGIDAKAYAMAYAKEFAKPAIGCAVILKGEIAFNVMMNL